MRAALAFTFIMLLAGACGETKLNRGVVIGPVEHIANQCPTQKDIPEYKINAAKNGPGIEVETNDLSIPVVEVDGHQKTRTFDKGRTYYIYRAGCKDGGYNVSYQYLGKSGSIKVQKTRNGYISAQQYGDEKPFQKQITK